MLIKKWKGQFAILGLSLVLGGLGSACSNKNESVGCQSAADCQGDPGAGCSWTCPDGSCQASCPQQLSCQEATDCQGDPGADCIWICPNGSCQASCPQQPSCQDGTDCPGDPGAGCIWTCPEGNCTASCSQPSCKIAGDCQGDPGAGCSWTCPDGSCQPACTQQPSCKVAADCKGTLGAGCSWTCPNGSCQASCPASTELLWYDNCEKDWEATGLWNKHFAGGDITLSHDVAFSGKGSYKVTVPAGTAKRAELVPKTSKNHVEPGSDWWYGWAVYIPNSWHNPTQFGTVGQWHFTLHDPTPDPNPHLWGKAAYDCDQCPRNWPPCGLGEAHTCQSPHAANARPQGLSFHLINGTASTGGTASTAGLFYVSGSDKYCSASCYFDCPVDGKGMPICTYDSFGRHNSHEYPIKRNQWNTFVVHYHPSYLENGGGLVETWVNGTRYEVTGPNMNNDPKGKGPYYKIGLYLTSTYAPGHTLYLDELRATNGKCGTAEQCRSLVTPKRNLIK